MGKGSSPAGNVTSTQVNPTGQAQLPYLKDVWGSAQNLYNQYSGDPTSLVPTWGSPALVKGYNDLYAAGQGLSNTLQPLANQYWQQSTRDYGASPAYGTYQGMAAGSTAPQQQLAGLGNQAQQAAGQYANAISQYANPLAAGNLGLSQLGNTASGAYLNSNPYIDKMVQSALDPVARNFQTAVAPQLDASFATAGRYGSGAMLGQRENAQRNLTQQLGDISSNLYGTQYARERQAQDAAAQQYGSLYNQGLTGAANIQNAAGNQYLQGLQQAGQAASQNLAGMQSGAAGLQGGYQAANQAALSAAQMYPQLAQAQMLGANAAIQAGQGSNQLQQQYLDAPFNLLQRYTSIIGQPQSAGSTSTQPYFQNQGAGIMSGITGALDILPKVGTALAKI
jgi:hypothetical protein